MLKRITLLLVALVVGMVAGCVPATGDEGALESAPTDVGGPTGAPERTARPQATRLPDMIDPTERPAAEATAAGQSGELSPGEVPQELFDAVLADALDRSGAARSAVTVEKSAQVRWNDGSLGCPQPGMMYTMAIVDGYHVILNIGGEQYDYRLGDSGYFVLCEQAFPSGEAQGTPTE